MTDTTPQAMTADELANVIADKERDPYWAGPGLSRILATIAAKDAETERLRKANGTLFAGIRLHQQENTTIAAERDALKAELVGAERRIANQRSTIDVMTYRALTLKAEVERLSQLIIMAQGAIDPGKHPKLFAVLTPAKETDNG